MLRSPGGSEGQCTGSSSLSRSSQRGKRRQMLGSTGMTKLEVDADSLDDGANRRIYDQLVVGRRLHNRSLHSTKEHRPGRRLTELGGLQEVGAEYGDRRAGRDCNGRWDDVREDGLRECFEGDVVDAVKLFAVEGQAEVGAADGDASWGDTKDIGFSSIDEVGTSEDNIFHPAEDVVSSVLRLQEHTIDSEELVPHLVQAASSWVRAVPTVACPSTDAVRAAVGSNVHFRGRIAVPGAVLHIATPAWLPDAELAAHEVFAVHGEGQLGGVGEALWSRTDDFGCSDVDSLRVEKLELAAEVGVVNEAAAVHVDLGASVEISGLGVEVLEDEGAVVEEDKLLRVRLPRVHLDAYHGLDDLGGATEELQLADADDLGPVRTPDDVADDESDPVHRGGLVRAGVDIGCLEELQEAETRRVT
eukprot:6346-Hanusia_phi.AAC.3